MGQFGKTSIRFTWYGIVLPSLVLNYYGQGALLLQSPDIINVNPFYALAPKSLLYPLVILATIATIIASQAMITGVFSLTQQAIQLGFFPRMLIVHTSKQARGQIYMPLANWILMIACLLLVLTFKDSSHLAGAYGISVTATMAITSFMYFEVIRIRWKWSLWQSAILLGSFLLIDCAFLGANLLKIVDGGWITKCIAVIILTAMITWRDGQAIVTKFYSIGRIRTDAFLKDIAENNLYRIPGTALFMSIIPQGIPHTLLHHLKHNVVLHERVLLLSILSADTPTVAPEDQVSTEDLGQGFYRIKAKCGFMESPDMRNIFSLVKSKG